MGGLFLCLSRGRVCSLLRREHRAALTFSAFIENPIYEAKLPRDVV